MTLKELRRVSSVEVEELCVINNGKSGDYQKVDYKELRPFHNAVVDTVDVGLRLENDRIVSYLKVVVSVD